MFVFFRLSFLLCLSMVPVEDQIFLNSGRDTREISVLIQHLLLAHEFVVFVIPRDSIYSPTPDRLLIKPYSMTESSDSGSQSNSDYIHNVDATVRIRKISTFRKNQREKNKSKYATIIHEPQVAIQKVLLW